MRDAGASPRPRSDALDDRQLAHALKTFVLGEFEAPVSAIIGLIELLVEDVGRANVTAYLDDLEKMRVAGLRMNEIIADFVEGRRPVDDTPIRLRHDLRTPVTSILGYGELLADEMRDGEETRLLDELADIIEAAGRLLSVIERLVEYASDAAAPASGGQQAPEPVILRRAAEVVRRLATRRTTDAPRITGRVLVVDDNESILTLITRRLEREGHRVETCGRGELALARLRAGSYDLVLLDLLMPGMSGLEVLTRIKEQPETAALPVIMISALEDLDTIGRCLEAGADDYLSKPLNPTLLRARIVSSLDRKFLRDREHAAAQRLREEQERSDALLRNVLPNRIVERLRMGEEVAADHFDEATILFCDLVGFTALTAELRPSDTVDLLNEIFSGFDRLAAAHRLEKIKTIGDAYMVAGGVPDPMPDHALAAARMALGIPGVVAAASRRIGRSLNVRIGLDTGPAVAGIIGTHKFFYDVWGDTVNTASRMENLCEPGRIHLSAAARAALGPDAVCTERGVVDVKGKGPMRTFYLDSIMPAG